MGAYLPLRNGSREFITDMDTYEERYQQEWAEELKQQEEEKKLRQEESPFGSGILKEFKDKGFFKLDEKGEVMKGDDPWTKEVETDKIQFAPTVLDDIPIPVQKKMIGMGKMTTHALSNVVNFPFALYDLAKTTRSLPYQQIHDLFKSNEQKEKINKSRWKSLTLYSRQVKSQMVLLTVYRKIGVHLEKCFLLTVTFRKCYVPQVSGES